MVMAFRDAIRADRRFIVASWVASFRESNTAGLIQADDWWTVMYPQIEKALDRPDVRTVVAYETTEKEQVADLYGFVTADTSGRRPLVYYVYTKQSYRQGGNGRLWKGPGVARQLLAQIGVDPRRPFDYVCSTPLVYQLELDQKIPFAEWQPLLGRYPKDTRRKSR